MSFLLDTNVVSEWVKPTPDTNVVRWLREVDEDQVFLSVASLAEIRRGIEMLDSGRRRDRLTDWLLRELPARSKGASWTLTAASPRVGESSWPGDTRQG